MKLGVFYKRAIGFGLKNDPRSGKEISEDLRRVKKAYNKLSKIEKAYFDSERLEHPYADTRILHGNPETEVKTILAGIDMETQELVLADRLRDNGMSLDLVLSHHPEGRALSKLDEVMHLHRNMLVKMGINREIADNVCLERISEVSRGLSATNHTRSVEAARLLNIPYMCVHTPADNHVATYLQDMFNRKKPKKIKDALKILRAIPEYRIGMERGVGPTLIAGKENDDAGKVFIDMTGGTEGPKKIYARLHQAGVRTVIGMHLSETHYKDAKAENIKVIIAGHITSDMLGLNLLLDNIEKKERLNIIGCSGFTRIRRA